MDVGSPPKASTGPASAATPRVDLVAAVRAVRTDLPPAAAVGQVAPVEAARFEPSDGLRERAALDDIVRAALKRDTIIDPTTRAVITQTVDEVTGEVVAQTPDEAMLRLRAYLRETSPSELPADPARVSRRA